MHCQGCPAEAGETESERIENEQHVIGNVCEVADPDEP
jgi:hypothetical protein